MKNEWKERALTRRRQSQMFLAPMANDHGGLSEEEDGWLEESRSRLETCGKPIGQEVQLAFNGPADRLQVHSIETCRSISGCPCCSARIRINRISVIQKRMNQYSEAGKTFALATFTLRHKRSYEARESFMALTEAWHKMTSGRGWEKAKEEIGLVGWVRAMEVTVGENGWHPHLHVILVLDDNRSTSQHISHSLGVLSNRWTKAFVGRLDRYTPSEEHGVDVTTFKTAAEVVVNYAMKLQEGSGDWDLANEAVAAHSKTSKNHKGLHPFDLLDESTWELPGWSKARARLAWREYAAATRGVRVMAVSKSLQLKLDADPEPKDEDNEHDELEGLAIIERIDRAEWLALLRNPASLSARLADAETVGRVSYKLKDTPIPNEWFEAEAEADEPLGGTTVYF